MSPRPQPINYPVDQTYGIPGVFITTVEMDTNAGNAPDGIVDRDQILDTTTVPAYAAVGLFTLTLARRYTKVIPLAVRLDSETLGAVPGTVVDGSAAANTVKFSTWTLGGAAVESNNVHVEVTLLIVP